MSEQDDFLIGNNRLDESLLMDMSDIQAEQSAVKPANRRKKTPVKRNATSPADRKGSGTAERSHGARQSNASNDAARQPDDLAADKANHPNVPPPSRSDGPAANRHNGEAANQQDGGALDENFVDIDSILEDPWGNSSDAAPTMESTAYGNAPTEFQLSGEAAERQNAIPVERSNDGLPYSETKEGHRSIWEMDDPADVPKETDAVQPAIQTDGMREDASAQDSIWEMDGPLEAASRQSEQPEEERSARSSESLRNAFGQEDRQSGTPENQRTALQAFQPDGEPDIWDGFPADGQGEPSMGERNVPENDRSGETAEQEHSQTEKRREGEPDIWDGGEAMGEEDATAAYDDIWDCEVPVRQPSLHDETAKRQDDLPDGQSDGEAENRLDDDFFRRNSIFGDVRVGGGGEDSVSRRQPQAQTDDTEIWSDGAAVEQESGATVDLYSCFPSQQFDGDAPSHADYAEADAGDDGRTRKIVVAVIVMLAGVALLCGGGYFAYSTYARIQEERTQQVESQQKQDSLTEAQDEWDRKVADAKALIEEIRASVVKDDKTTMDECDKLSQAAEGNPMTEDAADKKLKALNLQYDATEDAYQKALQSKSADVSNRMKELISQAEKLGDAPDSSDKNAMNSLVEQWKDTSVTSENVADVSKALSSLQSSVDKVSKAKTDAENAKREEEERKKAEEESQRQQEAQQQQSQQSQQQYTYTPQRQYTYTPQQQTQQQQQTQPQQQTQSPSTGGDGNSGVMF